MNVKNNNAKLSTKAQIAKIFTIGVPAIFLLILIIAPSRRAFLAATEAHPLILGFIKFALLASVGEVLAGFIGTGSFNFPSGAIRKAIVWGFIGILMALLIPVYSTGVAAMPGVGAIGGAGGTFLRALACSVAMNLTFGISMMAFHRVTDTMIDRSINRLPSNASAAVSAVDWSGFVHVVVFKNIPIFWIPAHTITFLLPAQLRVFLSAILSIVLGLMLAIAKKRSR